MKCSIQLSCSRDNVKNLNATKGGCNDYIHFRLLYNININVLFSSKNN